MSNQGVQIWWASNVYDSIARVCIPLFVMLAGALLLQPSKAEEPLATFYKKRWNRIGIPFIFWGIIYFAWSTIAHNIPLSIQSVTQGILTGPYYHFWFLYLLIGLYLLTPILRVALKYASRTLLKYTLTIWFVGTALVPLMSLFGAYYFNANLFIFTGWLGYFVLGAYLTKISLKRSILYAGLIGGLIWTIFGTYLTIATLGQKLSQFFYDGFSVNMIIASASIFILLFTTPKHTFQKYPNINRLLATIGSNTLPIFFLHVIILESLQYGYFGFTLSITSMNPFIAIPLITGLTLVLCLVIILPLKRIPCLNRLIG